MCEKEARRKLNLRGQVVREIIRHLDVWQTVASKSNVKNCEEPALMEPWRILRNMSLEQN